MVCIFSLSFDLKKSLFDLCIQVISKLLNVLDKLSKWVDETPPIEPEEQRFGNKAFRDWWFRVRDVSITGIVILCV